MAPSTTIGSLTDELVASLVPADTAFAKLRKLKDNFNRQLRHHNYARTNQFEVAERLDGLQEKFLVLNRDDLADAFHSRLRELKAAGPSLQKWLPDVLHLLLLLSEDPVRKTNVNDLAKNKSLIEVVQSLRWSEVEAEDPIDRKDELWKDPEFSDFSSDEDVLTVLSEPSSPHAPENDEPADDVLPGHAYLVDRDFATREDGYIPRKQIWHADGDTEIVITELQAVRETLFMLQGLPTTLFWRVGHSIEIDKRFRLNHASFHLLREILQAFANVGLRVDSVRTWLKKPQAIPFMQSLRVGIEQKILDFESCISQLQSRLLAVQQFTMVSLAKALEDVTEHSKLVVRLASFLEQAMSAGADSIECLDLLYSTVCSCQALGSEDLLEPLAHLFIKTFEVYLEPVLRWTMYGEVDSALGLTFVDKVSTERSLHNLWHDWYQLKNQPGSTRTPRLMQPFVHQIFTTGKTMVFLRHLPNTRQDKHPEPKAVAMAEIQSIQLSTLLPFSEAFEAAIKHTIGCFHRSSSTQLREKLGHECGLWRSLDALQYVFFGTLGSATDAMDARIFDRIDQGNATWNDRYLLTELCRNTFGRIASIDTERINVRAGRSSSRDLQSQRRSVKMLENIVLDYTLPWPVANIISGSALQAYQRICTFLFQVRRARYVLERRCRPAVMSERLDVGFGEQRLAQAIHCQLLVFVNYLYDHLTLSTIEHATSEMRQMLAAAVDVDGMIQIHHRYITELEEMCLVSRRLGTIKRAVMMVLDLCIRFSDTVTSPVGRRLSIDAQSFKSAASQLRHRSKRRDMSDTSSDEESSESEGFSTFVTFDDSSYEGELRHIQLELDRQHSFIVAGLKSISRVDEQGVGWDVLAERLVGRHP